MDLRLEVADLGLVQITLVSTKNEVVSRRLVRETREVKRPTSSLVIVHEEGVVSDSLQVIVLNLVG